VAAKLFNRVASLRIAAGLTQSELAARIHVSPETVAAIENGRQDATLNVPRTANSSAEHL
jgi:putative transcriptional regulator